MTIAAEYFDHVDRESKLDSSLAVEVPFIKGMRVRIAERPAFVWPWDTYSKRFFRVWIEEAPSAVLFIDNPDRTMYCSDHEDECLCKNVARQFMSTDPE